MRLRRRRLALLVALFAPVAPACSGSHRLAAAPATPGEKVSEVNAPAESEIHPVSGHADSAPAGSTAVAAAPLEPRSGSRVIGTATFEERGGVVHVTVNVSNAAPGRHGLHIHEKGDCSAADASSAGPHFNPDALPHGAPEHAPHHAGDLGNIVVDPSGTGRLVVDTMGLSVREGTHSVVGHALVVHADPDDLKTQPAGGSGARIACGVITRR